MEERAASKVFKRLALQTANHLPGSHQTGPLLETSQPDQEPPLVYQRTDSDISSTIDYRPSTMGKKQVRPRYDPAATFSVQKVDGKKTLVYHRHGNQSTSADPEPGPGTPPGSQTLPGAHTPIGWPAEFPLPPGFPMGGPQMLHGGQMPQVPHMPSRFPIAGPEMQPAGRVPAGNPWPSRATVPLHAPSYPGQLQPAPRQFNPWAAMGGHMSGAPPHHYRRRW